ncbi:MAG: Serine/threonine kinase [Alyxoria varia]|nr:MAG: Serine/threonine kinase [Alyxoria varia]
MDNNRTIHDVQGKIDREKKVIGAASAMRQSTNNTQVQSQADVQIREARRNIQYLESKLRELQMRSMGQNMEGMSLGEQSNGGSRLSGQSGPRTSTGNRSTSPYSPHDVDARDTDYGPGGYSDPSNPMPGPPRPPYGPPGPGGPPKARPNFSKLDLIKDNTPHLGPRIQLMLSQLQFKLNVEEQYKDGIEKIMGSYAMEGDRKIRQEAQGRRVESMQKIQLLSRALKRYKDLHVDMETDLTDDDSTNAPNLRKPLSGLLSLRIHAVSDVNHAATSRLSRGPETFVIMKVEDEFKGRTKATRTDKWTDELHEIDINKGNEIELTVYDKAGGDHPLPIGMLWIRISDIAEEMRRKKIETEFNNSGWVSADQTVGGGRPANPQMQFSAPPGHQATAPSGPMGPPFGDGAGAAGGGQPQMGPVLIEAWFSLEPVGRIQLAMSFAKQTAEKKPFDARINRRGAIRQRKEDVHELYGHKFVAQQIYNIMRCAFCGELLKYATGMQCADCKYMCHEKCYSKVVTKCISKSNAESDPDEAKLNHRIPHRFEPWSNIGASWCCHCGYMLPLGRKVPRRCKECKLTAHVQCTHLVPDFCGMSMESANSILREIKKAQVKPSPSAGNRYALRNDKPAKASPTSSTTYFASDNSSSTTLPPKERLSYNDEIQQYQEQHMQRPPSGSAAPVGAASAAIKGSQPQHQQRPSQGASQGPSQEPPPRRPLPPRTDSSQTAAAAATAALMNKTSPTESRPPYPSRTSGGYPGSPEQRPVQQPQPPPHPSYDPRAYAEVDQQRWHSPPPPQQPVQPMQKPPMQQPPQIHTSPPSAPAKSPTPEPASIPQKHLSLGPATQFVERKDQVPPQKTQGSGRRIGLDHFNFLAVLGKGNFGKVMLAETKSTKQLYAIKVLKKEFIIENDEVESTKSERDVFIIANRARHPFLLNLHACFQTETRVYFVMEYISGGDLMLHIQRGQFGTKRAQFYAAEVCLALKYFHENGVVYRDLKLDNILLTLDGHIKIADYGLCKKDMYYGSTTSTFCGTPEFMAPEILLDKKYGRAVDWWAFGVLIYQMLLQQSPFRGEDEDEIYDAILADEPLYPIHMPRDSVSILQKLLTREPESRLGSGPTDAQEIMSHAFFRNINWDDIQEKRVPAPFLPQIKSATDTSNFDSEFTSVTPVLTPVQSVLSQAMQEEFRGFSYSADFV